MQKHERVTAPSALAQRTESSSAKVFRFIFSLPFTQTPLCPQIYYNTLLLGLEEEAHLPHEAECGHSVTSGLSCSHGVRSGSLCSQRNEFHVFHLVSTTVPPASSPHTKRSALLWSGEIAILTSTILWTCLLIVFGSGLGDTPEAQSTTTGGFEGVRG